MGDVVKQMKGNRFVGWYIRYKDTDGKRKQRASHQPTQALARRYLLEVEGRIARGQLGIPDPEPAKAELTLGGLVDLFLQQYTRPRLKDPSGYRAAAKVELGRLPADWLARAASSIGQHEVEELRDRLGRAGAKGEGGYKPNTINGTLRQLSRLYTWGAAKKLITCPNPCKGVERHRTESLLEYLGELDPGEPQQLLAKARPRCWGPDAVLPASLYPAVATVLYTGLRKGELWSLRWSDLDLATGRFDVLRAVGHSGRLGPPKGGKPRHLRLPRALAPILSAWRPLCPPTTEGLVFPVPVERWDRAAERIERLESAAGGQGDKARDARKMLARLRAAVPERWRMGRHDDDLHLGDLLRAAGCRRSSVGRDWHMLRHTFGRSYMAAGGNIVRLQEILGHATLQMTLIYARFAPGHLEGEMDRVVYAPGDSASATG